MTAFVTRVTELIQSERSAVVVCRLSTRIGSALEQFSTAVHNRYVHRPGKNEAPQPVQAGATSFSLGDTLYDSVFKNCLGADRAVDSHLASDSEIEAIRRESRETPSAGLAISPEVSQLC